MKEINAYQTNDGMIFADEQKAIAHELDKIGEEIDSLFLFAVQAANGNVTRTDQHRMVMHLLKNQSQTAKHCRAILKMIEG